MKLAEMTIESLGQEATERDLAEFVAVTLELSQRDGIDENTAADMLFGNGDYFGNARRLGLLWPNTLIG